MRRRATGRDFGDLIEGLPQTVFELDLEGRFTFVNRFGLEMFGYTEEDLDRGITVFDVVAASQHERLRANFQGRVAAGSTEFHEYLGQRRDGSTFPMLAYAAPVAEQGRAVALQGFLVDITGRKRVELELQRRLELERLVMAISTRFLTLAPEAVDEAIAASLRELGLSVGADRSYVFRYREGGALADNTHEWAAEGVIPERANLQGLPISSALPWFSEFMRARRVCKVDDVAALPPEASAERAEFERESIRSLLCVPMAVGDELLGFAGFDAVRAPHSWSDDEVSLLRIVGEIFAGAILRRRAEEALEKSERTYRALVETTATGFVILDGQGRVLDANDEYVRLTGRPGLAAIAGRHVVEWTAPHDRERNAREVARCLERGLVRNLTLDYTGPDGKIVPVEINATVVGTGESLRILSVARDISERRRLEAEMLRAEKLRSVGVLAGGIAHDFNNILAAILGNVSLVREAFEPGGEAGELLAEAERATLRASALTRQLLTFARGGAPVKKVILPGAVIRESATLALRGRGSALQASIDDDLWPVEADEGQIGQVVNNLVINASQAMNGGGTVTVSVRNREVGAADAAAVPAGRYVELAVADKGEGIPAENLTRIFDPYFTTKAEGSGLGLAVCYAVVKNHGGAVSVKSSAAEGTRFTVLLPASSSAPERPTRADVPISRGQGRVLVMDDDPLVRSVAGRIIAMLGYEVALTGDGRAAIEAWSEARRAGRAFDAAIVDLTVPGGMGGLETARELLALDPGAALVVSSGYHHDPVLADFRRHGFRDALAKPFTATDLALVLARVVARS